MELAGQVLPNPDGTGGVSIEKHFTVIAAETAGGVRVAPVLRYSQYGAPYAYPRWVIKLRWTDLVAPEIAKIKLAVATMVTGVQVLKLDGLKTYRQDIVDPPEYQGAVYVDEADVILAASAPPTYESVEGYREYGGTIYGPRLYTVNMTLIAIDGRYLQEEAQ